MILFDTHSHLFDEVFDSDRDEVFKRVLSNNIKLMIVGFSLENNLLAYNLAKKYHFYSSAGLHPSEASSNNLDNLKKLEEFIQTHKVYAIGECGLDYHWTKDNISLQKELFRGQIELSIKYHLPLIIHSRDALKDTYDILKEYHSFGIMHCYSGSLEMAQEFIKLNYYISLGGPLTFKNAKEPRRVCENIDLSHLLIETDCPYLAPEPHRGTRNESTYVRLVAEKLALIKGISLEEVAQITTSNAFKVFQIKEDLYEED